MKYEKGLVWNNAILCHELKRLILQSLAEKEGGKGEGRRKVKIKKYTTENTYHFLITSLDIFNL